MKLLCHADARYADADLQGGFHPPQFALVDLNAAFCITLNQARASVERVAPIVGPRPKDAWLNCVSYELTDLIAVFFNDRRLKASRWDKDAIGAVENSDKAKDDQSVGFQRVPDAFQIPHPYSADTCAISGDDGPVSKYLGQQLMATLEGWWIEARVKHFSATLTTALIPWAVLDEEMVR